MEEEHLEFSYDHSQSYNSKSYTSINNKDFERKCIEENVLRQLMEGQPEPTFIHLEVPYDLEQLRVYTECYQPISPFDICDGVVDLLHCAYVYIIPILAWIEEACEILCQFGKQFDEVLYSYDLPSIPPILDHHAGLHFLNKVSLLWLVTKDKEFFFLC